MAAANKASAELMALLHEANPDAPLDPETRQILMAAEVVEREALRLCLGYTWITLWSDLGGA